VSERNINQMITKSIVLHTVNLGEAAEEILKQNGLTDWAVEADSHPLFNVRMATFITATDELVNVFGVLANYYIATFHYIKEYKKIVFLPHIAYRSEISTTSHVKWDNPPDSD
jgi:hypothetical protein